jgi:hypothetical protein
MPRTRIITAESTRAKLAELGIQRTESYDRAARIASLSLEGDYGAIWLYLPNDEDLMIGGHKVPTGIKMLSQTRLTNTSKIFLMDLDPVLHADHPMINGTVGKCRSVMAIPLVDMAVVVGQITVGFERPAEEVDDEKADLAALWADIVVSILVEQSNIKGMLNDLTAAYSV